MKFSTTAQHPGHQNRCEKCSTRMDSIFCVLSRQSAKNLDRFKTFSSCKRGQILFNEGTPAGGVFCINKGKIKLYKLGSIGREQIVGIAGPGDMIGYRALFSRRPHAVTAEVLEDSDLCIIDRQAFLKLVDGNPDIAKKLVQELSQEVDSLEDKLLDQVDKPVHVRLARLLLMFGETVGKKKGIAVLLDIHLSRQDMANMIGTTQETVIRLLSQFKRKGLVEVDKRTLSLTGQAGLLKIARLEA